MAGYMKFIYSPIVRLRNARCNCIIRFLAKIFWLRYAANKQNVPFLLAGTAPRTMLAFVSIRVNFKIDRDIRLDAIERKVVRHELQMGPRACLVLRDHGSSRECVIEVIPSRPGGSEPRIYFHQAPAEQAGLRRS